MTDVIEIKNLLVRTIIGINPEERENRQDVLINLKFSVDTRLPGKSDDIEDAVNYRTICKKVFAFVESSSFMLVEKLCEEIAKICLADQAIQTVWVSVEKPGALRFAESVGITIERSQNG